MKNISTGAGLAIVGLGIALHPVVSGLVAQATAAPSSFSARVASAATAQAGPTIVWIGSTWNGHWPLGLSLTRLWSDGRLEHRLLRFQQQEVAGSCGYDIVPEDCQSDWREVPPPPGGNGFACRADINGDRSVDGADLGMMLNAWGQQGGCEPEATYPCLDLGNLAGGAVAAK